MDVMSSGNESDDEPMSTEMLEDIFDVIKSRPIINKRKACYKIHDRIKRSQSEWKGALLSFQNMGKGLHKFSKTVINYISQFLPILDESGSKVSYFIPKPRNFAEVARLSKDIKRPWLKATLKEIKKFMDDQNFLVQEPDKGETVTPYMDFYKDKIQSDGSLDKFKLRILIGGICIINN